jgi:MFS transporter, DHA2 family, multidrug resistance protein
MLDVCVTPALIVAPTGMIATASRAGRREWLGLAVIALPCLVYAMDLTVLNLALPALSADLRPTSTQLLWIVDSYGFVVAGALITMGALADRVGARRLLMLGAAGFAGASLLAAFAPSAGLLIAARALLGLAGATLAPSTLSLIRTMFEDDGQRTLAIGVWVMSYSLGAAVGPLAGGALLQVLWWGSVFLLGVPVMGLLLVAGPRLLPEHRGAGARRLDLASAALSLAAVLAVVYGVKQLAVAGGASVSGASIAVGLALGGVFVRRQRRTDPLIDLSLLRVRAYAAALATNVVAFFVIFGMSLFLAQYLQSVLGLSPLAAGVWSVPEALGFIAGSLLTPRMAGRWSAPVVIGGGLLVGAGGWTVVAMTDRGLAALVAGSTIGAVGLAAVVTLATDLAVSAAPPARAGAASAISETSSELGGALGIALLGSIGAAIYRAGIPADAPAGARETLAGALGAHGASADALAHAARAAFAHALDVTALVAAALLLAGAGAAALLGRRSDPVAAEPEPACA